MSPVGDILRDEISRTGPVTFHRFMEVALYHPRHGYYRSERDQFGKHGDYFTAEQVQPVFGILMRAYVSNLMEEGKLPPGSRVVELGAGRSEMAEYFAKDRYTPIEVKDKLPERFTGVVFANEFFDALPVHCVVKRGPTYREMRVGLQGESFAWVESDRASSELAEYAGRFAPDAPDGATIEVNLDALAWVEKLSRSLERGYVLVIDYGYTAAEAVRFPSGTLMSYRRHRADENVLTDPGQRDITAHVNFTALEQHAKRHGLHRLRFETLATLLLRVGERDQFAEALKAANDADEMRRRLQLKTLLFGMGETFRALLLQA